MKHKIIIKILLFIVVFSQTGCWNKQELNELAIALALGIDKVEEGYEVSVQIVEPSQMALQKPSERTPVTIFSETSTTLFESLRKMVRLSSRRIYISHIHLILLNEAAAKEGISETIDLLIRDHEMRPDFYFAIAHGQSAKDTLSIMTPLETLPAMDFYNSLQMAKKYSARISSDRVTDVLRKLNKSGIEPVLSGLTITGDLEEGNSIENVQLLNSPANFTFKSIGVLKEGKLTGWLTEDEAVTYNFLNNQIKNMLLNVSCPNEEEEAVLEVVSSDTKKKPRLSIDNEMSMFIEIDIEAHLGEIHCQTQLKSQKDFDYFQDFATEELSKQFLSNIKSVQSNHESDIFGFGEDIRMNFPNKWKEMKTSWNSTFKTLNTEVNITLNIRDLGKIINPINEMFEEPE
ncbi:hypothetical protein BTS2_1512 [Bacillus sp. TS-2]|nr:hypothetical protein BTS2_1512 [Bacillus sp. TS-2]